MISPSLSRVAAGIFEVELNLAKQLNHLGIDIQALGLRDAQFDNDHAAWGPVDARVFQILGPKSFGYSPDLLQHMMGQCADLVHLQALWMFTSVASSQWSERFQRPLIVSTHGMLEPWALNNSRLKKQIAMFLYERNTLEKAHCIHTNTLKELQDVRSLGLQNPICVIPNGVQKPDQVHEVQSDTGKVRFFFLGRKHPKKGLINLLDGLALLKRRASLAGTTCQLILAGPDQADHEQELIHHAEKLGLSHKLTDVESIRAGYDGEDVLFVGPIYEKNKDTVFRHVDVFVLPSISEGQPISVLEAMAHGIPVLISKACNMPEVSSNGAGIEIECHADSIAQGLETYSLMPAEQRKSVGHEGRNLVDQHFTWEIVAGKMAQVYKWISTDGPLPDCVNLFEK